MSGGPSRRGRPNHATRKDTVSGTGHRRLWAGLIAVAILVAIAGVVLAQNGPSSPQDRGGRSETTAAVGARAPGGTYTTVGGARASVGELKAQPTLLWFVATWCPSCQTGTRVMADNLPRLKAQGIRVVELQLYRNLGQAGPNIERFARSLAGPRYGDPGWHFGTASAELTRAYDPNSYLDIYYLIDSKGRIVYVNGSPGATMGALLKQARRVS